MFKRRPPLPLLAVTLALSAGAFVRADDLVVVRFGEYLEALRVQAGIPGLAAAIVGPAEVAWEGAFGQQDIGRNIVTRLDTPFHLDGTTQAIVASLAVRCASDGSLSLDQTVGTLAPQSPDAAATIGQVLTHTTAGPKGLTFSYRPERLVPACDERGWDMAGLLELPRSNRHTNDGALYPQSFRNSKIINPFK